MKRFDMINYISEELQEMSRVREYDHRTDSDFYFSKAAGLLDMLEGFNMLPPYSNINNSNSWDLDDIKKEIKKLSERKSPSKKLKDFTEDLTKSKFSFEWDVDN